MKSTPLRRAIATAETQRQEGNEKVGVKAWVAAADAYRKAGYILDTARAHAKKELGPLDLDTCWQESRRKVACNRALCLLKLNRPTEAVRECEIVLGEFAAMSGDVPAGLAVKALHRIVEAGLQRQDESGHALCRRALPDLREIASSDPKLDKKVSRLEAKVNGLRTKLDATRKITPIRTKEIKPGRSLVVWQRPSGAKRSLLDPRVPCRKTEDFADSDASWSPLPTAVLGLPASQFLHCPEKYEWICDVTRSHSEFATARGDDLQDCTLWELLIQVQTKLPNPMPERMSKPPHRLMGIWATYAGQCYLSPSVLLPIDTLADLWRYLPTADPPRPYNTAVVTTGGAIRYYFDPPIRLRKVKPNEDHQLPASAVHAAWKKIPKHRELLEKLKPAFMSLYERIQSPGCRDDIKTELHGIANNLGLTCEGTIYGDLMCDSWNCFERDMAHDGQAFGEWSGALKYISDQKLQSITKKIPEQAGADAIAAGVVVTVAANAAVAGAPTVVAAASKQMSSADVMSKPSVDAAAPAVAVSAQPQPGRHIPAEQGYVCASVVDVHVIVCPPICSPEYCESRGTFVPKHMWEFIMKEEHLMKRGTGNRLQFKWTARGPDQLPSVQDVFDAWRHHTALLFDWCSGFFLLSGDISKNVFRHNCVAAGIPVAESIVPKHHQHFHGYGYCLRAVGLDAEVLSDAQMRRALKNLMVMVNDTLDCAEPVFMALKMWSDLTDETIFETEKSAFAEGARKFAKGALAHMKFLTTIQEFMLKSDCTDCRMLWHDSDDELRNMLPPLQLLSSRGWITITELARTHQTLQSVPRDWKPTPGKANYACDNHKCKACDSNQTNKPTVAQVTPETLEADAKNRRSYVNSDVFLPPSVTDCLLQYCDSLTVMRYLMTCRAQMGLIAGPGNVTSRRLVYHRSQRDQRALACEVSGKSVRSFFCSMGKRIDSLTVGAVLCREALPDRWSIELKKYTGWCRERSLRTAPHGYESRDFCVTRFSHSTLRQSNYLSSAAPWHAMVQLFDADHHTLVTKVQQTQGNRFDHPLRKSNGDALVIWDLNRARGRAMMPLRDSCGILPVTPDYFGKNARTSLFRYGNVSDLKVFGKQSKAYVLFSATLAKKSTQTTFCVGQLIQYDLVAQRPAVMWSVPTLPGIRKNYPVTYLATDTEHHPDELLLFHKGYGHRHANYHAGWTDAPQPLWLMDVREKPTPESPAQRIFTDGPYYGIRDAHLANGGVCITSGHGAKVTIFDLRNTARPACVFYPHHTGLPYAGPKWNLSRSTELGMPTPRDYNNKPFSADIISSHFDGRFYHTVSYDSRDDGSGMQSFDTLRLPRHSVSANRCDPTYPASFASGAVWGNPVMPGHNVLSMAADDGKFALAPAYDWDAPDPRQIGFDITLWNADSGRRLGQLPLFQAGAVDKLILQGGYRQRLLGKNSRYLIPVYVGWDDLSASKSNDLLQAERSEIRMAQLLL